MLKTFSVSGIRNFPGPVTLDLSKTRDYQFNTEYIRDGIVTNALLIGKNSTGKTNLGLALGDICNTFSLIQSGSSRLEKQESLYLNADNGRGTACFRYIFQFGDNEVGYSYEKSDPRTLLWERLELNGRAVFDYRNDRQEMVEQRLELIGADGLNWKYVDPSFSLVAYFSNSIPKERLGVLGQLRDFVNGMRMLSSSYSDVTNKRASYVDKIISHGRVADFQQFLSDFGIEANLKEIKEADGSRSLYFEHSQRMIPFAESCSSGTETLLQFYAELEIENSFRFLYLDEFDAYCHFELAALLVRYFGEKRSCQTICTTHNTSLVRNDVMRPDCIFQIDAGKIRSLADSTDREIRQGNNVEKLLRNGEFE